MDTPPSPAPAAGPPLPQLMPHAVTSRVRSVGPPTWARLAVIVLAIGGGFSGLTTVFATLFSPAASGIGNVLLCVAFIILYALVTATGVVLVVRPERTWPFILMLLPQVPMWTSSWCSYLFTSGPWVMLRIGEGRLYFGFQFGSQWQVTYDQQTPFSVGINVFAVVLLMVLIGWRLRQWEGDATARH